MIIGIDLGTSTSEVATLSNGRPAILRSVAGSSHGILPSVVGIAQDGKVQVGEHAASQLVVRPEFTVAEVKRKTGTDERLTLGGEQFTPQELSAFILRHLKEEAERAFGTTISDAVITVPAYFTAAQRQATREAGELAGLTVKRLINEPTAAALAYGLDRPSVEEKLLVYDLGGGTLDVTVLELSEGVLDVMASTGNSKLGGKDFDERLMAFLNAECLRITGIDLAANRRFLQKLKSVAKNAKEELSSLESTTVVMDNIGLDRAGTPVDFEYTVERAKFESLIRDLVNSTRQQIEEALEAKGLAASAVDRILLVGGSTRIPLVRQLVGEFFPGKPLLSEISPDEAVALGAAIAAGIESRELDPQRIVITDVCPWTLGVAVLQEIDGETVSDMFSPLIQKQSTIPRTARKSYTTAFDWQEQVRIEVYQGDAPHCKDNILVGRFLLDQLPPAPAGQEIQIEFSYNLSNEVDVLARHPMSGREMRSRMVPGGQHLSAAEKAAARERVDRAWSTGRASAQTGKPGARQSKSAQAPWHAAPSYARVAPLVHQAEKKIPSLDLGTARQLKDLVDALKQAVVERDEARVKELEIQLVNTLFELE